MSDFNPYVDFDNRKLTDETGGAFSLPTLIISDVMQMSLRGLRRTTDGVRTVKLNLRGLKASIGPTMAPSTGGGAKLRFGGSGGDPETAVPVSYDANATAFSAALTGVSGAWTPAEVVLVDVACWLVRFTQQTGEAPLQVGTVNTLTPRSLVRVRGYQLDGVWWHEVRFLQSPLAFSNTYDEVLPPAPSIVRIQGGGSDSVDIIVNEIQQLTLPPTFRGTYVIKWNGRVSSILGIQDEPDEMAAALNAMWVDGLERFKVTNPDYDKAHIEFVGLLGDTAQNLMTIEVKTFEPGSPTVVLDLDTAEMGAAMRTKASLDTSTLLLSTGFELELTYVEESEDPDDNSIPSRRMTMQLPVKVAREQVYPELETVSAIDWLRKPVARDYVPFDPDQVVTGSQFYSTPIGNGVAVEFDVTHGLDSEMLIPEVRENVSGGRLLGRTEYSLKFPDSHHVIINFAGTPPAANALRLTLLSPLSVSALRAHTHSIGQITGLQDILDGLGARVTALEDMAPALTRAIAVDPTLAGAEIIIDDIEEIFPMRRGSGIDAAGAQKDQTLLPRPSGLLPAIHDASATGDLVLPLVDPLGEKGNVYRNNSGNPVDLPGALGLTSFALPAGGFAGSDGRMWYPLTHSGTTTSYFPAQFERELFLLSLAAEAWQTGGRFEVTFDILLQMLSASTRTVYTLVIESGTAPADTSPATTDPVNLSNITWDSTPLLTQRIVVTGNLLKHHFGVRVNRSATNVITADQLKYAAWTAADAHPATSTFVIRARLIRFDTENNAQDARGFIYRKLEAATASIQ